MEFTKCTCNDWKIGLKKIDTPIALEQIRGRFKYPEDHFLPFKFCPWCGKSLKLSAYKEPIVFLRVY